jgi:hypothetical protein
MPEWLRQHLPPAVVWTVTALSVVLFLASALAIPWFLNRIPHDYFSRRDTPPPLGGPKLHPALRVVLRNLLGAVLLLAGIAMLVLPGQGLLAILVSLFLIDFPGKRRLQQRIVAERHVFGAINRLRRRFGHPPLEKPRLG